MTESGEERVTGEKRATGWQDELNTYTHIILHYRGAGCFWRLPCTHCIRRDSRSSSSSTIVDHCYTVGLGTVRVARGISSGSGGVTAVCGRVNSGHHLS